MSDSKGIFLPFTTPVLGTYGSTWESEAFGSDSGDRSDQIGLHRRDVESLIFTSGLLPPRLDAFFW